MLNRFVCVAPVALTMAAALPALAGYTATTGVNVVNTPQGANPGPDIGDLFSTAGAGTFVAFLPDGPSDPQITGGDLPLYRYTLSGAVSSVDLGLGQVGYTGTYTIFYDGNGDGLNSTVGVDFLVSGGNFLINAQFTGLGVATLSGALVQTMGPAIPAFADLSYGGNPVLYSGLYVETDPGVSGTIEGTLRQNVPAPAALALLGMGGTLLTRRKRATR